MKSLIIIIFAIFIFAGCRGIFSPQQRTPVTFDCEGLTRWTKKLDNYPYKMASRILKLKIEANIFESADRIKRYSDGIPLEGKVVYIKSDFVRLKNKTIIGTSIYTSKGPIYNLKLNDRTGPFRLFIAPPDHYGYYEWGKSKYALICDLDPFKDD